MFGTTVGIRIFTSKLINFSKLVNKFVNFSIKNKNKKKKLNFLVEISDTLKIHININ